MIKRNAIVITAGLENPDKASCGVKYPITNRTVKIIIAVRSSENNSVVNKRKPRERTPITNKISGVIQSKLLKNNVYLFL